MITPLGDNVLITTEDEKSETQSGIIIPETAKERKPMKGTVVAIGRGKEFSTGLIGQMEVQIGDKVIFEKYGADDIEVDGVKYKICPQQRIYCKYEDAQHN